MRVVVYTAVVGDYDDVGRTVGRKCDYIYLSDRDAARNGWHSRRLADLDLDPTRMNRHPKLMPHRYFSDYDVSIYIDGNVDVLRDPWPLALETSDETPMLCFGHPERDSLSDEAAACIRKRKDDPVLIQRQVNAYLESGVPDAGGLIAGYVLVRRHNDPRVVATMETWWNEVATQSKRDQLSFPYAAWKCDLSYKVMGNCHADGASRYFLRRRHSRGDRTFKSRVGDAYRRGRSRLLNRERPY